MKRELLLTISVVLIIFLAGCTKEKPKELQFKNDVVTIENYFVSNVAPYERGDVNIQFDVHNNGDQKIPYLEIDFFDLPGFNVVANSLKCEPIGQVSGNKCIFKDDTALETLDVRTITIQLQPTEDVTSPTPHTVSFAVRYTYFGSRDVSIPVIDGQTRKQPLTKFRQSTPSIGPVALDIDPAIEREIAVGGKTIRENWAIGGDKPLPFLTKFKFKHVGSLSKVKDVNITLSSFRLKLSGLNLQSTCDFCDITAQDCKNNFNGIVSGLGDALQTRDKFYKVSPTEDFFSLENALTDYNLYSKKSALVTFDTLICTFTPSVTQPEYSAVTSAFFAYKYEFIKNQDFVIQPLPE